MGIEVFNLAVISEGIPAKRLVSETALLAVNELNTIQVRNETRIPALIQIHVVQGGIHDVDDGAALGLRFDGRTLVHQFEVGANGYHLENWQADALQLVGTAFSALGYPWVVLYGRKGAFVSVQAVTTGA